MKRKVSTQLDELLIKRAKLEAVRQGKHISTIIGTALSEYLDQQGTPGGIGGVVASTWGVVDASETIITPILEEEEDFLGA